MNVVLNPDTKTKPVTVVGKAIAARLAQHHQDARALLALNLVNGEAIPRMSRRQAAQQVGVSRYRIALAAAATAGEIECVKLGRLRLRDVRAAHAKRREATVDDLIDRYDANVIMAAFDRLTAPTAVAAE